MTTFSQLTNVRNKRIKKRKNGLCGYSGCYKKTDTKYYCEQHRKYYKDYMCNRRGVSKP